MSQTPDSVLDYQVRPSKRKVLRPALVVLALALLALGLYWFHRPLQAWWRIRREVAACERWHVDARTVIYEGDWQRAKLLLQTDPRYSGQYAVPFQIPAVMRVAEFEVLRPQSGHQVFTIHKLTSPRGVRLVALEAIGVHQSHGETWLAPWTGYVVLDPGTWIREPALLGAREVSVPLMMPKGLPLRVFGGQADPADAASVLFRYECGTREGRLRLRLLDDDTVDFSAESGPLKESMDEWRREAERVVPWSGDLREGTP